LLGKKTEEQYDAIAVTVDGVGTGSSKAGKVIREVISYYATK
jgi:hypothetical protein